MLSAGLILGIIVCVMCTTVNPVLAVPQHKHPFIKGTILTIKRITNNSNDNKPLYGTHFCLDETLRHLFTRNNHHEDI